MRPDSIMPGADFGKTAADYAAHRAGPPDSLFERLAAHGIGLPGQRIWDLGSGTGALARPLASRGARVVSSDISLPMLQTGVTLARQGGVIVEPLRASAEQIPVRAGALDVITASQCWHWFDRPRTATECFRVLRHGGQVAITHFDWIPRPGNVVEASEALILAHNPQWGGAGGVGQHPHIAGDVAAAGFRDIEIFAFDVEVPYTHEGWRGRIRASAGVGGFLPPEEVARFDAEHAAMLAERFPEDPLRALHRVWTLVAQKPPASDRSGGTRR